MKKTKFAVLFTALTAMLGLSSCLGEPDPIQSWAEYVKVGGDFWSTSFIDAREKTITPTNQDILTDINSQYAFISYNYDTRLYTLDQDRKVELTGLIPIETKNLEGTLEGMEDFANSPIFSLEGQLSVAFWDKDNMFVPIYYFAKKYDDEDEQTAELNSHSFAIYYDNSKEHEGFGDDQMVLYLRHNVSDDSLNKERKAPTFKMFHYNVEDAVLDFESVKGKKPRQIIIMFEKNTNNSEYGEDYISNERFEIDYSKILEYSK